MAQNFLSGINIVGDALSISGTSAISSARHFAATSITTTGDFQGTTATFSGDVGMVTGHSSGKFAVMSSAVHGSYDFYNNGTSYFNGDVTIDANITQTTGTTATFSGRVSAGGASNPTGGAKLHVADGTGAGLEVIPSTTNNKVTLLSYDRSDTAYQSLNFEALDFSFLNGNATFTGNVGIGDAPDEAGHGLEIHKDGSSDSIGILIHNKGTNTADDAKISFETQGSMDYTIGIDRSDGNKFKISRAGDFGTNDTLTLATNNSATFAGDVLLGSSKGLYTNLLQAVSSAGLKLGNDDNSQYIFIKDDTGIGIGTTSPDAPLHILKAAGGANIVTALKLDPDDATNGSGVSIDFNASSTNTGASLVGSRIIGAREAGNASGYLSFYTSPDASGSVPLERMRITSGGNVGIGTVGSDPLAILDVETSGNTAIPALDAVPGASTSAVFRNSGNTVILATGVSNTNVSWLQGRQTTGTGSAFNIALNPLGGDVGIGETSPDTILHVTGDSGITIEESGGSTRKLILEPPDGSTSAIIRAMGSSNGLLLKAASGGNQLFLKDDGNVGIGAASPEKKLHILTADSDHTPQLLIQNSSTGDANLMFNISGDSYSVGIDNSDDDKFKISAGDLGTNDRFTINASGQVGIGTSSPTAKLEISGGSLPSGTVTNLGISTALETGRTRTYDTGSLASIGARGDATSVELVAGSSAGYYSGIGLTARGATAASGTIIGYTYGVARFRVDADGDFGINTTNPLYKLHVVGTSNITGNAIFGGNITGINGRNIVFDENNDNYIYALGGSSSHINIMATNSLKFKTAAGQLERMRIDTDGHVHITSGGDAIAPTIKHSGVIGHVAKLRVINRNGQSSNKGGLIELGGVTDDGVSRSDVFGAIAGLKDNATSANREGSLILYSSTGSALTEALKLTKDQDAEFAGIVSVPTGKAFRMYNAAGTGWSELTFNESDNKVQFNRGIQPSGNEQADQLLGNSSKRWHTVYAKDGNFSGDVTIEGNLVVDGITTTINSQTVSVDDKNIELGAVVPVTGQTATLANTSTAVVTVTSTSGYLPGATLTKTDGDGAFGSGAVILTVDSSTQFTASVNHATADTITFTVGGDTDLTADGGGITLKGTTDKTITWTNSTDSWDFNQHILPSADSTYNLGSSSVRFAAVYIDSLSTLLTTTVGGNLQLQSTVQVLNKAQTSYINLAARDTTGSEVVYNLSNLGTATFAGKVQVGAISSGTLNENTGVKLAIIGDSGDNNDGLIITRDSGNQNQLDQFINIYNNGTSTFVASGGTSTHGSFDFKSTNDKGDTSTSRLSIDASGNSTFAGGLIVNEGSNDADFRVESNGEVYMLRVDGGNNRVGIATQNPSTTFHVTGTSTFAGDITATGADISIAHASGPELSLRRDDHAHTIADERLGQIQFGSDDPTDGTFNYGAAIKGMAGVAWDTDSFPGYLIFQTRNTSGALATALTLDYQKNAQFTGTVEAGGTISQTSGNILGRGYLNLQNGYGSANGIYLYGNPAMYREDANTLFFPLRNISIKNNGGGNTKFVRIWNTGTADGDDAVLSFKTESSRTYSIGTHRDSGAFLLTNADASVASGELLTIDNSGNATFAGTVTSGDSTHGRTLHGSKSVTLTENTFTTVLTVNLAAHRACYVKIFATGDWSGHSAVNYLGEYFLTNGNDDNYNEPGMIIREVDNTKTDTIVAKIVDPGASGTQNFIIQLKADDTVGSNNVASKITYEVMGQYVSVT